MSTLWMFPTATLLAVLLQLTPESKAEPQVQITQGHLQGSILSSIKGRPYVAFKGVPYAHPPVGANRFSPPLPPLPWNGTLLATKCGASCPQLDFDNGGAYAGEEDCLFLNIYTPELSENNPKPVMLFFHGGAFNYGNGNDDIYGGGRFMDYNVVLVVMNYRLGVFGFLNVNEDFAPGNVGLLDQVEALKWIKRNIRFFGGDPNKVTIFGQSAGGASVVYHLLSPLSRGLFHRAIAQSGSPLCKWSHIENPVYWAKRLAEDVECPVEPLKKMVECLKEKPAEKLVSKTTKYYEFLVWPMPFVPSDQRVKSGQNFLAQDPGYSLKHSEINNVPVITGVTKDEGLVLYLALLHTGALKPDVYEKNLAKFLTATFQVKDEDLNVVLEAIRKEYLEGINMEDEGAARSATVDIISDGMNDACGLETAEILSARKIPTYTYLLEHQLNMSITQRLYNFTEELGVAHGDDLILLFEGPRMGPDALPYEDERVSQKLLKIWTHFANHGVPDKNKEWPAMGDEDQIAGVRIADTVIPITFTKTNKLKLWDNLVNKVKPPVPLTGEANRTAWKWIISIALTFLTGLI